MNRFCSNQKHQPCRVAMDAGIMVHLCQQPRPSENPCLKIPLKLSLLARVSGWVGECGQLRNAWIAKQQRTPSFNYDHSPFYLIFSGGEEKKPNIPESLAVWQAHGQWLSCPHHVRCQSGSLPRLRGHPSWSRRHGHGDQETSLGQSAAVDELSIDNGPLGRLRDRMYARPCWMFVRTSRMGEIRNALWHALPDRYIES